MQIILVQLELKTIIIFYKNYFEFFIILKDCKGFLKGEKYNVHVLLIVRDNEE